MSRVQNYDQLEILYAYSVDYEEREIFLFNEIDEETGRIYLMALIKMLKDPEPITIFIKSPGGDDFYMFALWDLMVNAENRINTVVLGSAQSAAHFLMAAGTIGHRYISEHSTVMAHQSADVIGGKTADLESVVGNMRQGEKDWAKALATRTKLTAKQWMEYTRAEDKYIGAEEAIRMGLADWLYALGIEKE